MSKKEFLDSKEVCKRYSICLMTLDRWQKRGLIPQPLRFGRRVLRWRLSTLESWEQTMEEPTITEPEKEGTHA